MDLFVFTLFFKNIIYFMGFILYLLIYVIKKIKLAEESVDTIQQLENNLIAARQQAQYFNRSLPIPPDPLPRDSTAPMLEIPITPLYIDSILTERSVFAAVKKTTTLVAPPEFLHRDESGLPNILSEESSYILGSTVSSQQLLSEIPSWDCLHLSVDAALNKITGSVEGAFVIRPSSSAFAAVSISVPSYPSGLFHIHVDKTTKGYALKSKFAVFFKDLAR